MVDRRALASCSCYFLDVVTVDNFIIGLTIKYLRDVQKKISSETILSSAWQLKTSFF